MTHDVGIYSYLILGLNLNCLVYSSQAPGRREHRGTYTLCSDHQEEQIGEFVLAISCSIA